MRRLEPTPHRLSFWIRRLLKWVSLAALAGLLAVLVVLFFFGHLIYPKLLVQPARYKNALQYVWNPFERTKFEVVTTDGLRLACFYGKTKITPPRGTCVILHGHSYGKDGMAWLARKLTEQGFDVVGFDARAHGESEGEICTVGDLEGADANTVVEQAEQKFALPHPRIVIGQSLGAATAIRMITLPGESMDGAIIISPYARLRDIVEREEKMYLPWTDTAQVMADAEKLAGRKLWDFAPVRLAPQIGIPVLVLHGTADTRFRLAEAREVYDAVGTSLKQPARKVWVEAKGAGHNDLLGEHLPWSGEVSAAMQGFLDSLAAPRR